MTMDKDEHSGNPQETQTLDVCSPPTQDRERKPTERGGAYMAEIKFKSLAQSFRTLKSKIGELNELLGKNEQGSVPAAKGLYSDWLDCCEDYMKAEGEYLQLLISTESSESIESYTTLYKDPRDVFMKNFKVSIENWFETQSVIHNSHVHALEECKSTSGKRSRHSSQSSEATSLSLARIREEQKQAEIDAKMAALAKKKEIELAKLNLRMLEEEHELNTEKAISDSKSKIIEKYERSDVDIQNEIDLDNTKIEQITPEKYDTSDSVKVNVSDSLLNPHSSAFVPVTTRDRSMPHYEYNINDERQAENRSHEYTDVNTYLRNVNCEKMTCSNLNSRSMYSRLNSTEAKANASAAMPQSRVRFQPNSNPINSCKETILGNVIDGTGKKCTPDNSHYSGMGGGIGVADRPLYGTRVSGTFANPIHTGSLSTQYAPTHSFSDKFDISSAVVSHLKKPVCELKKFGGNPMEFRRFVRQFNGKVSVNTDNFDEKMNFLEQFTFGEANKVVSGFSHLDASEGFPAAMKELEDRYGDSEIIASAFIKKALDWPTIKPDEPKGLDDFALFLVESENAVRSIEALKVLEYSDNMKRLLSKLPFYLHDRWRNIVRNIRIQGGIVSFSHLVQFVKDEAKKSNDPVYGKEALYSNCGVRVSKPNKSIAQNTTKGSFAVSELVSENDEPDTSNATRNAKELKACMYCDNKSHTLSICQIFGSLANNARIDFLKSKGVCFGCLKPSHMKRDCRNKLTCDTCGKNHPTILHIDRTNLGATDVHTSLVSTPNVCSQASTDDCSCAMTIIPVRVRLKNRIHSVMTYAFCTESLLKSLGITGKPMRLTLDTMGNPFQMTTQVVNGLQVCNIDNGNTVDLPPIYSKEKLPVNSSHIPTQMEIDRWSHLEDIRLKHLDLEIGLMIGSNVPDAYTPFEIKTGPSGSPHATLTRLGWAVWNMVRNEGSERCNSGSDIVVNRAELLAIEEIEDTRNLERAFRESMNLDFPERIIEDKKEMSVEDERFLKKVNDSIKMVDGHYSVDLPFRDESMKLPNNESMAHKRLVNLKSKLLKDEKYRENYTEFMSKMLEKGHAEVVPLDEVSRNDGRVWYIPHHGVYHPHKPNKIRVVFDCSATYQGVSLNEQLLQGPDLTNKLIGVLLRFRQENVAVMGDIESMFFQIKVTKTDTDCLRFFWWPNGNLDMDPVSYRMLVQLFGGVSSPSCANFALRKTVEDNASDFDHSVAETIRRDMYVDDLLSSVPTEADAIGIVDKATRMCAKGGFKLTKWTSNSSQVVNVIDPNERAQNMKHVELEKGPLPSERALGVFWDIENDSFGFNINLRSQPFTRRGVLSVVSSVYDPIGLAVPSVLRVKILLQELCKINLKWDDPLPENEARLWRTWLTEVPRLEDLKVPRCFKPAGFGGVTSCQIHNFCDASTQGYGVVSYIRLTNELGDVHCAFLMAKGRVAPLKQITVPRLELTAATVAVRLNKMVSNELDYPVDSTTFWTDSTTVLRYIANENARFHTFVANRLAVIRDGSSVQQWRHVDTKQNPADHASRGLPVAKLLLNHQWLNGPDFLWQREEDWPQSPMIRGTLKDDPEVKHVSGASIKVTYEDPLEKLESHFSDWNKLKRATGWWLFVIEKLRRRINSKKECPMSDVNKQGFEFRNRSCISNERTTSMYLSVEYLRKAEIKLIQRAQRCYFPDEYSLFSEASSGVQLKRCTKLRKLDPFLKDGVLRVGGRLERAFLCYDAKHPIILPKRSKISKLMVEAIHKTVGHLGKNSILAELSQRFWMIGAANVIRSVIHRCVICRRYQAPNMEQKMANLPSDRLTPDEPPFTRTGVDFFGPFEVKQGRSRVKRYGVIFTCLNTRAVHLEVSQSLDTDSCINCIRRFVARRGPVKYIHSDNGTNFVGAERELKEEIKCWNTSKINAFAAQKEITWCFNPPAASHFGGVWERLIRSVRKVLYSLLHEQVIKLNDEGIQTLFCEVESIVNGRPLTEATSDSNDLTVLTPNHLLLLRPGEYFPPGVFSETDNYCRRRWRQIQYLADVFWSRWRREYLPLLQKRQKWFSAHRNAKVGDIVLISDNTPRNSWGLGRIVEIYKDKSGLVRSAKVKTQYSVLSRPIAKLCLILEGDDF